jgi:hypothetical protein
MNSFSIDLGFDWNIKKEDRERHLQECFFMKNPTIGTPSYFRVAAVGDLIDFNIYDITVSLTDSSSEPPGLTSTITKGCLRFRSADGGGPPSPFGATVEIPLPTGPCLDLAGSLTFNGLYPHWRLERPPYPVTVAGKFIYMAELCVEQDGETKYFVVDPEMETGSGG